MNELNELERESRVRRFTPTAQVLHENLHTRLSILGSGRFSDQRWDTAKQSGEKAAINCPPRVYRGISPQRQRQTPELGEMRQRQPWQCRKFRPGGY